MKSPVSLHDVASETGYRIPSGTRTSTIYEQVATNDCIPSGSILTLTEADIVHLIGKPMMTEEERLYRKILRRRPKMLELAAAKGLLCDS